MIKPDSPYTPVASVTPTTEAPNDYIRSEATPGDMGAQVGGAVQQAGQTVDRVSAQASDWATQQQGMINQSLAQNAETDYITKLSGITDKYKTLEGLDAVSAHDQTVADISALRQKTLASIPTGGAQRAFNTLAQRHEAYAISDVGSYWSQQVKGAALKSSQAVTTSAVDQAGAYAVAADDGRSAYTLQTATLGLNDMMSHQGYSGGTVDPATGKLSFDTSTADGKAAQSVYDQHYDQIASKAWSNRIHTLADDPTNGNVQTALRVFNANKDKIPAEAQMELSAYLTPKMRAINADGAAGSALQKADEGYRQSIGQGAPAGVADAIHGQESGGRDSSATSVNGARGGWQVTPGTFQQYAKPGEKIDNPADNEAVGRRIIDDLSAKFGGDPARIAVGYFSGPGNVAPAGSPTPWIEDKKDGNGTSVSTYVAGVTRRMAGGANYSTGGQGGPNQVAGPGVPPGLAGRDLSPDQAPATPTATPDPPPQSKADYYRAHEADIVASARQNAMQSHPDDPVAADLAASRAQQQVSAVIRQQDIAYHADSDMVYQAANGDLSKGTAPTSVDQLRATSPQVAQAWDRLAAQQPQVAHEIATRLLNENAKMNGGDAKTYGSSFLNVFNRIHAAEGDPNKITDPKQVYSLVGNGLTMSGLEKVRQEIAGKSTPDGEAESAMRAQFFRNAHGALTGTNDGLGLKDPKGEELYLRFMAQAYKAIDAGKSAGKTPAQLFDPASPDYVGKIIAGMKRTPAQFSQDLDGANGGTSAPAAAAVKSYQRADLEAEMVRRGLLKNNAPPPAPAAPDNQPHAPY